MGAALWKRPPRAAIAPDRGRGFRYRIEVFGQPRAPWRKTAAEAMNDAIRLGLACWDASRREHFLAVPVDMRVFHITSV